MIEVNDTVLAIVAHPDDAELTCAGTLALLKDRGWKIEMATMTPGDCGTSSLSREEISSIRKKEAAAAASLLDASYHCLDCDDIFILYDKPTILKTTALIRKIRPKMVFTMSPSCYMVDHEITSRLVQTACFSSGIKNIETEGTDPFFFTPYLYYVDAMEGKDKFGAAIDPSMIVDISSVMDTKEEMLKQHDSQRSWLRAHHGMDEYVISMKSFSAGRGTMIPANYGEGFRQHLGHAFPQNNLLKETLGDIVVTL